VRDETYTCTTDAIYYTAAAGTWTTSVSFADGSTTGITDSNGSYTMEALSSIEVTESGINYSEVAPGGISTVQSVTITNKGNIMNRDFHVNGTDMVCTNPTSGDDCTGGSDSIVKGQQHWSLTDAFTYAGGSALLGTSSESSGCAEIDLSIVDDPVSAPTAQNEYHYWRIQIPANQKSGPYTGTNTFASVECSG
jgi:hypothetical protein